MKIYDIAVHSDKARTSGVQVALGRYEAGFAAALGETRFSRHGKCLMDLRADSETNPRRTQMPLILKACAWGSAAVLAAAAGLVFAAEVKITPGADGTLVDGGIYGTFDGAADAADWYFNDSSYEGAITLIRMFPELEQRVVWEFNLGSVMFTPPVTASFTFTLRGAARFPAEPAEIYVYSYPADGSESLADFGRAPVVLVIAKSILPYQPATTYTANVNEVVNAALSSGAKKVAFRMQVSPEAVPSLNQAFMDIAETDPSTKPFVTVWDRVPSDSDDDGDVDLADYAAFRSCMQGPGNRTAAGCEVLDADWDSDVDLQDLQRFLADLAAH